MTIYCWNDYTYYDGLLTFAQGIVVDGGNASGAVYWLDYELPHVRPSS